MMAGDWFYALHIMSLRSVLCSGTTGTENEGSNNKAGKMTKQRQAVLARQFFVRSFYTAC